MRKIHKSVVAAVLVVLLAMPVGAAGWPSSGRGSFIGAFKRFVVRVWSRISPPGSPDTNPDEPPTTTTDGSSAKTP